MENIFIVVYYGRTEPISPEGFELYIEEMHLTLMRLDFQVQHAGYSDPKCPNKSYGWLLSGELTQNGLQELQELAQDFQRPTLSITRGTETVYQTGQNNA